MYLELIRKMTFLPQTFIPYDLNEMLRFLKFLNEVIIELKRFYCQAKSGKFSYYNLIESGNGCVSVILS